jgi:hypothetical protein
MKLRLATRRWKGSVEVMAGGEFVVPGIKFYRRRRSKKNAQKREE